MYYLLEWLKNFSFALLNNSTLFQKLFVLFRITKKFGITKKFVLFRITKKFGITKKFVLFRITKKFGITKKFF